MVLIIIVSGMRMPALSCHLYGLKGHNMQHIVIIRVNMFQTEFIVEFYSKSLVEPIRKVLLMKFS